MRAAVRTRPLSYFQVREPFRYIRLCPAHRTCLRGGVEPVDEQQFTPVPRTLVLQLTPELIPRRVIYRPGKLVVLRHILAAEILQRYNVVVPHNLGRRLVQVVAAPVFGSQV